MRKRSRGHESVEVRVRGVPRRWEEKSLRAADVGGRAFEDVSDDGRREEVEAEREVDIATGGRNGRRGPFSRTKRSCSRAGLVAEEVPTEARRRARLMSCSRMMEEEEEGLDRTSLESLRSSTSRTKASASSPSR